LGGHLLKNNVDVDQSAALHSSTQLHEHSCLDEGRVRACVQMGALESNTVTAEISLQSYVPPTTLLTVTEIHAPN